MGRRIPEAKWRVYFDARDDGASVAKAARKAAISVEAAYSFERGEEQSSGVAIARMLGRLDSGFVSSVSGAPADALDDFGLFRRRFFGRRTVPWQERAAYQVLQFLDSPDREYVVINAPPGSGKSTLFTHDIPAWLICRRRTIRILLGSRTGRQARTYVERLRQTLEAREPLRADPDEIRTGLAFDAEATIPGDYGQFKPEGRGLQWTNQQFYVATPTSAGQKEPTVAGYGQDEASLGTRVDLVLWDDLVDEANLKGEGFEKLLRFWQTNAERRVEPGGAVILQGQRMGKQDLYRWALDVETADGGNKYHHIKFRAHNEEGCTGQHDRYAQPWPDGCLLDPMRLPWKELENYRAQDRGLYELQFQQEDDSLTENSLVTQQDLDACYNRDRALHQPPDVDNLWSVVSVDPSPAKWWAIQWWLVDTEEPRLYLMETIRRKMSNQEFLMRNEDTGQFTGALETLRATSTDAGHPMTHLIVEVNAAQRWLLSQTYMQKWLLAHGVTALPHTTGQNKTDPAFGVGSLGSWYAQHLVDLPDKGPYDRVAVKNLTDELKAWPEGRTDDQVMAHWFVVLALQNNYAARRGATRPAFHRPSWVRPSGRGLPSTVGSTW